MAKEKSPAFFSASPRQLVLIGVLAILLVAALLYGFRGESSDADRSPELASPAQPLTSRGPAKPAPPRRAWPRIALADALQFDPFAPLASPKVAQEKAEATGPLPETEDAAQQAETATALESQRVTVIIRDHRGAAAAVGGRLLRVGDVIDGFEVTAIDEGGVKLKAVPAK
jgi:hypothetical protein